MSTLSAEEEQRWVPTHVQVTVLRGRSLRGKGKHGTSDVYTIIQLGKEKYSTCVAEKTTAPEWKEECSFELLPGVLEVGGGGRSGYPGGSNELVLIVMHRALIGLDVFLGQAVIQLDKMFRESRCVRNEWYRLNSKTGKKEKERGDIQVTVQFTRNNLTASMYDLVMKDKSASTFGKLKERMKGKRRSSEEDSSSAVLPSGHGSLQRMRQRLPSDGGGEEDYEDDEGGEVRRSKMRNFFLRGKLRKSSDTRSSTSLGSESSESSSRGGSLSPTAGISVVVSDLSNSPSNSSNLTADNSPEHTANTSPKLSPLRCEFGEEGGEITIAVPPFPVCVNGSHAYSVQPVDHSSGKPAGSLGLGLLPKSLPLSMSLQNLCPRAPTDLSKSPVGDGRRWSFDKPGEEEKAAIAAALEQRGPMTGEDEEQLEPAAVPQVSTSERQGKKQRKNLLSHGNSESAGKGQSQSRDESEQAPAPSEEKHKSWFRSKESHSKPSLVVSPKIEPSTESPPLSPSHQPAGPLAPPVDQDSLLPPLHHTNPFCTSQITPPPISPSNPFFPHLQHNPFCGDAFTEPSLKPPPPPLPYLSTSRPPIAQLFPEPGNTNPALPRDSPTTEDPIRDTEAMSTMAEVEPHPLPPNPMEGKTPPKRKSPNPFMSTGAAGLDAEWDESFEAFAAGRLQSPEDPTSDCKTQHNTPDAYPLEHCNDIGTLLITADADQSTNVNEALHPSPLDVTVNNTESLLTSQTHQLETFVGFLDTIIEQTVLENHQEMSNNPATNQNACTEMKPTNSTANTTVLHTNTHQTSCHSSSVCERLNLNSSPSNPGSSGVGSLAEEDFLSCLSSSYSACEKFSASSSDDAEAQNFESSVLGLREPVGIKSVQSEDGNADRSSDWSLACVTHQIVTEHQDVIDSNGLERSLVLQPSIPTQQPTINTGEEGTEHANTQTPRLSNDVHPDVQPNMSSLSDLQEESAVLTSDNGNEDKGMCELNRSMMYFPEELKNPFPDDATFPSFHIMTSSPGDRPSLSDSPFDNAHSMVGQDESRCSPLADFLNATSGHSFDDTLLHTQVSNRSTGSLYVSTNSQHYQTCLTRPSSKCSSASVTLHSADSTLCGEEIRSGADLNLEESICGSEDRTATLEPHFMIGDDFGLQILPTAPVDAFMSSNPEPLCENAPVSPDHSVCAPLQRSQSEGSFRTFDDVLMPSFGSDPGVMEPSSALPCLHFPPVTSFAPSFPAESSSPIAACSFPSLADASARPPPGSAQGTVAALAREKPMTDALRAVLLQETQQQAANRQNSPHPVKPLTTATLAEEKRTEGRSVLATGLEKLKSTIHPGRTSQLTDQEADRKKCLTEGAGTYYHLNHSELVALLVQREADLARHKAEHQRQGVLLAKREVELKRLKPQIRDLEDYIDTLLVRIMEQKPTLLQVRSKFK
ncbi:uncharacterized protein rab11fip5a [Genypterus blacodes]|uniref:uncharacterized protein rab11fip5a n=1 Tax=Genypterus blacodes TaxID=154954 RepID=UPI003F76FA1C